MVANDLNWDHKVVDLKRDLVIFGRSHCLNRDWELTTLKIDAYVLSSV